MRAPGSVLPSLRRGAIAVLAVTLAITPVVSPTAGAPLVATVAADVPAFTVAPTDLPFGSRVEYSDTTMTVTVSNPGPGDVSLDSFSLTSQSNSTDDLAKEFSYRPDAGCPTLAMLAAAAACDISVDFRPVTTWGSTGSLTFNVAGVAQVVTMSGTGTPSSAVVWGPRVDFHGGSWSDGNAVATSTSGSTVALHSIYTTDLIGSHFATDSGPHVGVYYRRSTNHGSSWTSAVRINPSTQHGELASLAASGTYVYVTYVQIPKYVHYTHTGHRVLYIRINSNLGSGSWHTARRLTSTTGRVDAPVVAAYGSYVYVAYTDASTGKVHVLVSHNHGTTWSTKTLGTTTSSTADGREADPSISAWGKQVVVAWRSNGSGRIISDISQDAGATWHGLTMATSSSDLTATAASGGKLAVAWAEADGLRLRVWKAGIWGAVASVLPPAAPGFYGWQATPAIAISGSTVAAAWSACRSHCTTSTPYVDLVWAESTDGGTTFPHRELLQMGTTDGYNRTLNFFPSVALLSPTERYVTWSSVELHYETYAVEYRKGVGAP